MRRQMTTSNTAPALGGVLFMVAAFTLGGYFTFAAVQGDYGVFRQVQIKAELKELTAEKAKLEMQLAQLTNLTHRLSDDYLDIDLLDERARDVLGYMRPDELLIR